MTFYGKIIMGETSTPVIKLYDANNFQELKYRLLGKEIELQLKKKTKKRSNPQNAYYWGCVLTVFGNALGYTAEEMHLICADKFLKYYEIGKPFPRIRSTTELSTVQFNEYCSQIQIWASTDFGIYIPDPNEWELIKAQIGS